MQAFAIRVHFRGRPAAPNDRTLADVELEVRRALENLSYDVGVIDVRVEPAA